MALAQQHNSQSYAVPAGNLSRTGPRMVAGSTTAPRWVISSSPRCASRRAARRTGSISAFQLSLPLTARAISLGQTLTPAARACSVASISCSSCKPCESCRRDRQAAEQKRTASQLLRQRFCHSKRRPQTGHVLCSTTKLVATLHGDQTGCHFTLPVNDLAPKAGTFENCEMPRFKALHRLFYLVRIIRRPDAPLTEKDRGPGK